MQKIKLITDPAVKIRVYLECENKIFLSGAGKRMNLETIDNIDIPLPQFIFLSVHEQTERALQKNPYFQIVMAVRTAGSHFHDKKFQIIHYRMGYDLKLFFLLHSASPPACFFFILPQTHNKAIRKPQDCHFLKNGFCYNIFRKQRENISLRR